MKRRTMDGWGPDHRAQAGRLAGELRALLENAAMPGPYVLVTHSASSLTARLFAEESGS